LGKASREVGHAKGNLLRLELGEEARQTIEFLETPGRSRQQFGSFDELFEKHVLAFDPNQVKVVSYLGA
jgi:hypothetical protein